MKSFVLVSLLTAFIAVGCSESSTVDDKPNTNDDAGADAGTPTDSDASTTDPDASATDPDASVSPKEVDEVPGNDSLDAAQSVAVGQLVKATSTNGETDFFALQIPDGVQDGVFELTLDEASSDYTPGVRLYGSNKSEITTHYAADGTTRPFKVKLDATAGKLYYVEVFSGPSDAAVPYTLATSFTAVPDASERNDSFDTAKPATIGTAFDLYLFAGADTNGGVDEDFFTIDAPADKTKLRVKIENKSTSDAPQTHAVALYKSDKAEFGTLYAASEQADVDDTIDLDGAGAYYLKFFNGVNSIVASKVTLSFE